MYHELSFRVIGVISFPPFPISKSRLSWLLMRYRRMSTAWSAVFRSPLLRLNATPWLRLLSTSPANYIFIAIYQYSYADLMPLYERAETILFALLLGSLMLFINVIIFTDVEIGS